MNQANGLYHSKTRIKLASIQMLAIDHVRLLLVCKICKSHFPHWLWSGFACNLKPIKRPPHSIINHRSPIHLRLFIDHVRLLLVCKICKSHFPHWLWSGFACNLKPIKRPPHSIINHRSPIHLRLFIVLPNCFWYLLFISIS